MPVFPDCLRLVFAQGRYLFKQITCQSIPGAAGDGVRGDNRKGRKEKRGRRKGVKMCCARNPGYRRGGLAKMKLHCSRAEAPPRHAVLAALPRETTRARLHPGKRMAEPSRRGAEAEPRHQVVNDGRGQVSGLGRETGSGLALWHLCGHSSADATMRDLTPSAADGVLKRSPQRCRGAPGRDRRAEDRVQAPAPCLPQTPRVRALAV